jgi:hypothetical protein
MLASFRHELREMAEPSLPKTAASVRGTTFVLYLCGDEVRRVIPNFKNGSPQ